ncbi:MAG: hypothetical protein B7Y35_06010 [Sphingomonadales bacterium 28-64-96]|nr:MAG: hypothetical protein B7Y35_06010 [Sphingomonadales bacterium 28-64-96]
MCPRDQALKRATRLLVDAAGGCENAAALCRVGKSQLAAAGCINEPDRWLPVDALRDLMGVTRGHAGAAQLLAHLAAEAGFVLVPVSGAAGGGIDALAAIADLSRETAQLVGVLAEHAAGGADPRRVIAEADDVMAKVAGIRAAAEQLERERA